MTTSAAGRRAVAVPAVIALAAVGMWFTPPPQELTVQAWRLFVIFAGAIVFVRHTHPWRSSEVGGG